MNTEETNRQILELRKLNNKLKRYWRRLVKEALNVAKKQGLELIISDDLLTNPDANQIVIHNFPDGLEDERLLELAKREVPSLYRRFQKYMSKYESLRIELREELSYLSN